MLEETYIEGVEVGEHEDTNTYIVIATKEKIQKVHVAERTSFPSPKSSSPVVSKKNILFLKRKKVSKGPSTIKRKLDKE